MMNTKTEVACIVVVWIDDMFSFRKRWSASETDSLLEHCRFFSHDMQYNVKRF